jgi:arylsulfatase A-like enzyme
MTKTTRSIPMRLLASVLLLLFLNMHLHGAAPRPNIIWIMADDMGFSDIGCYGGEISTPNIDALAKNGLRYTQFYNTSRCCPTRASLLTGLYPHQAGVGHMVDSYAAERRAAFNSPAYSDRLSPATPTIAEVLKQAGYRTFMAGKWHLGYRPEEWPAARGFDRSFTLIEGAMNYFGYGPQHSLPKGEQGYGPMALDRDEYVPPKDGFFATDTFTDYAIKFIREHRGRREPFFLYVAHVAPHWPLHARPEAIEKYRGKYREGWDKLREQRYQRLVEEGIIDRRWPLAPRPENLPAWDAIMPERQRTWDERMADERGAGSGTGAGHTGAVLFRQRRSG